MARKKSRLNGDVSTGWIERRFVTLCTEGVEAQTNVNALLISVSRHLILDNGMTSLRSRVTLTNMPAKGAQTKYAPCLSAKTAKPVIEEIRVRSRLAARGYSEA